MWNYGKYLIALALLLAVVGGSYSVWKAFTNPVKVITGTLKDALPFDKGGKDGRNRPKDTGRDSRRSTEK